MKFMEVCFSVQELKDRIVIRTSKGRSISFPANTLSEALRFALFTTICESAENFVLSLPLVEEGVDFKFTLKMEVNENE